MKDLLILLTHLLTTAAKLLGPGGARAVVADSLLMKQQLLVINRCTPRAGDFIKDTGNDETINSATFPISESISSAVADIVE